MFQFEHMAMAAVFFGLALWLFVRGERIALICALWSQVPFWGGTLAWIASGRMPVEINLVFDLIAGFGFLYLAHVYNRRFIVVLCLLMATMGAIDLYASLFGVNYYLELHEALHYLALIVVGLRSYVDRAIGRARAHFSTG